MKRPIITLTLTAVLLAGALPANAQQRKSFEEFRSGILKGYSDFRKKIIDNYEDFLKGEWHEYESLNAERRDKTPKPHEVPAVPSIPRIPQRKPKQPAPSITPEPEIASIPATPSKPITPAGKETPSIPPSAPSTPASPSNPSTPASSVSPKPSAPSAPVSLLPPASPAIPDGETFSFYNIPVSFPRIDFDIAYRLGNTAEYAAQWKDLAQSGATEPVIKALQKSIKEMGLNSYLAYELLRSYINSKFPQADDSSRMSAIHYFLTNMGYDVRIGMTTGGAPMLLIPFDQRVYGRNYLMVDGTKYYVFTPENFDIDRLENEGIRTCTIPGDAPKGEKLNLVLSQLNIPMKGKNFDFSYGPIHLTGEVNENLMPILYQYPQMPIEGYALSEIDPELRKSLVKQMKEQLKQYSSDQAVGELLNFMHNVFQYATDEENHGFEKPYFLEETLYYPKNDCEDRAIFYTYFLWNVLGKEAQLISFPGHEAATVRLDNPVKGTSFISNGKIFYISDPTFIGSQTGMIMPAYRTTSPTVDYTYQ